MASNESCPNCQQLKQIKTLSRQVLKKYDELLEKYKENEEKYNEVVKTLQEREATLEDMKGLIEPAVSEHERLKIKYDIEVNCRHEAENVARRVTSHNITLKRQSQALLSHIGKIDITQIPEEILEVPEDEEVGNESYKVYTDQLNNTIKELEEKVAYYMTELTKNGGELTNERETNIILQQKNEQLQQKVTQTENALTQYQKAMGELATMSESAYKEYKILQNKYEIEAQQRDEIEKTMKRIKAQNDAMKTQSSILLSKVADNQQLTMALCKVEELEEEKVRLERQVSDLQIQMSNVSDEERNSILETENEKLIKEIDELTKKITNYEQLYGTLQSQYKTLERQLEKALRPPSPPPPPPPPPPPTTQSRGFLARIKGKKKQKAGSTQQPAADEKRYSKALEEMMKRINSGKPILRQTSKQTKDEPKEDQHESAMQELNNVLHRFKNTKPKSGHQIRRPEDEKNTDELNNALNRLKSTRKTDKPNENETTDEKSDELHNALNRLKSSRKIDTSQRRETENSGLDAELVKAFRRVKWEEDDDTVSKTDDC